MNTFAAQTPWLGNFDAQTDIALRVRNFLSSRRIDADRIEIDVHEGGVVALRGQLASLHEKERCLACCRRVAGVTTVIDELLVAPTQDGNDPSQDGNDPSQDLSSPPSLTDGIPALIAYIDADQRYRFVNQTYCDHFQQTRESLLGRTVCEVLGEENYAAVRSHLEACLAGQTQHCEFDLKLSGTELTLAKEASYAPDIDPSGEVRGCYVLITDITERKQWERELAEKEAQLRRVIDNMLAFVGVLDTDGTLLEVNKSALAIAGLSRDDVIGQKFWDCYWWNYDELVMARLQAAVERARQGETVHYDAVVRTSRIGRIDIEFMLAPSCNAEGKIVHLIPSGVDITERKQAETELVDNKRRLLLAMEAARMGSFEWEPENDSAWWDEALCEITGLPADAEITGETFFRIVHPDDVDDLHQAISRVLAGHGDYEHEFRIIRPDGQTRWLAGRGKMVQSRGESVRLIGVNWDITDDKQRKIELQKAREAAEAASRAKSEFVANMSHEIRTPMTAVLGYADLLAASENDPEKLKFLRTINRNGKFLLDIINDILDLSKIEAGKLDMVRENFAVEQVVSDVYSIMQMRAREKHLDFDARFDGPIPEYVQSDPKRLRQILINLVGNAIKFTASGSVSIVLRYGESATGPYIEFDVIDTGIGLSKEQESKLFEPFSQGDGSVRRTFGGTGLGLAISQRLAGMLGGEITVESRLDEGSKFTFRIAAGQVQHVRRIVPQLTTEDDDHPKPNRNQPLACRVLVVDDRRDVRFLAQAFLEKAGADVECVEDGIEAIRRVERISQGSPPINVVLLDMQMPRLDGYDTAARLRELGFLQPIVALTADAMADDIDHCLASGCDAHLSKPIDAAELLEVVANFTQQPHRPEQEQSRQAAIHSNGRPRAHAGTNGVHTPTTHS